MTNLWPAEITEVSEITPPVVILEQQATMLGDMTKNIVLAEVKAEESKTYEFSYTFDIVAPILDNYRYRLLTIYHHIDFYPLIIAVEKEIYQDIKLSDKTKKESMALEVDSESKFLEELRKIFRSNKTKRIISALLAQSKSDYNESSQ